MELDWRIVTHPLRTPLDPILLSLPLLLLLPLLPLPLPLHRLLLPCSRRPQQPSSSRDIPRVDRTWSIESDARRRRCDAGSEGDACAGGKGDGIAGEDEGHVGGGEATKHQHIPPEKSQKRLLT